MAEKKCMLIFGIENIELIIIALAFIVKFRFKAWKMLIKTFTETQVWIKANKFMMWHDDFQPELY